MRNAESKATNEFRLKLESCGAYFVKLSDRFTRGVPDSFVVTSRGVTLIEFKYGDYKHVCTWKELGLSGLQDQRIREICKRNGYGACVIIMTSAGEAALFVPVAPWLSEPYYRMLHNTFDGIWSWLLLRT